jgi:hypothetical protein
VSRTRIHRGLTCEIEDGPWKLTADMPTQAGGDGAAPTPGDAHSPYLDVFSRAQSCRRTVRIVSPREA